MRINAYKMNPLVAAVAATVVGGVLVGSGPAMAQLEEVIVTANKKAESANDIGMSISAFSADQIAEERLMSLEDIALQVPGLNWANSQQNTPILTMRGVGFNESSLGVYPAVSMYVDEVPLPFPVMGSHTSYDVERIEVLKGPQGVLFGQNSTGGAINFIAAKPTEELAYHGDVTYGRFNMIEGNGYVSGTLTDKLRGRLAVQSLKADDWQKSVTTNEKSGKAKYTAGRMLLTYEPTDRSTVTLNVNGWKDKSDPTALQFIAASPKRFDQAPDNAARIVANPYADSDARSADWSPIGNPEGDREFYQGSLRGEYDFSESTTLTAIASYSDFKQDMKIDGDGANLALADLEHNKGKIDSTYYEVRLAGDFGPDIDWLIGTNYENSNTEEDQLLRYGPDNTTYRPQTLYINGSGDLLKQDIESYAVFGNVDYHFTESLTLKLGARYTDTQIDAYNCGYAPVNSPGLIDQSGGSGSNVARLFDILGGRSSRPFDPLQVGDCYTLDNYAGPSGAPPAPEYGIPGIPFKDSLSEDNTSWRVGLDYMVSDTLLYATVSQGYKAGSYPALAASTYYQLEPVTQEKVLAYEVGFKATLADNRIQWNGAAFYYDYKDKQVRGKITDPIFGPLDTLVNVPKSEITGAETEIVAQLAEGLTLSAAVTYLDSEVKDYVGFSVLGSNPSDPTNNGDPEDLSGNALPFTPEWSYTFALNYSIPLDSGELYMGANLSGQSESDSVFNADSIALPADRIANGTAKSKETHYFQTDDFNVIGAQVGFRTHDDRWNVMVWGKNITDEYYLTSVIASSENGAGVAGRPRTYGITVGYTF